MNVAPMKSEGQEIGTGMHHHIGCERRMTGAQIFKDLLNNPVDMHLTAFLGVLSELHMWNAHCYWQIFHANPREGNKRGFQVILKRGVEACAESISVAWAGVRI